MIKESQRLSNIFEALYKTAKRDINFTYTLDEMMESNETRLSFLIELFNSANNNSLKNESLIIFNKNIDFIHDYINGECNKERKVPEKYIKDMDSSTIVPTTKEIIDLFKLIKENISMYNTLYKNEHYLIKLPDDTFNMNMYRALEVRYENLAHLMGLTETEIINDPNKNLLKKHFKKKYSTEERKKYGEKESEQLLNWFVSDEGINEILKINKMTTDFINEDMKQYPDSYKNGVLKEKSIEKFKRRFKEATSYDYPIIKFSRYMAKCINNINFFNMNNICNMILDYTSELDLNNKPVKKDEKDIFVVNVPMKNLYLETKKYLDIIDEFNKIIKLCAIDSSNIKRLDIFLENYNMKELKNDIMGYINLIKTGDFISSNGINVSTKSLMKKINDRLSSLFENDIHIVGFGTVFESDINIPINEETFNTCHCDTSISIKIPEMASEYYHRGRSFFIDKIEDGLGDYARISVPEEEIEYRKQVSILLGIPDKKITVLNNKFHEFNELYDNYNYGTPNFRR